jgi:uncharacterized protein
MSQLENGNSHNIDTYSIEQSQVITSVEILLQQEFGEESSGHDWLHLDNARQLALHIAEKESGEKNVYVVELGTLLHDYNDWKFQGKQGTKPTVRNVLEALGVEPDVVDHVSFITENISYKGGTNKIKMHTLEGQIVQDADRLTAIGATGIARTFMYGGSKGLLLHNPSIPPIQATSFEEFKQHKNTIINHFYEKLLLLKDQLNTDSAKQIAEGRHDFMLQFWIDSMEKWTDSYKYVCAYNFLYLYQHLH